MRMENLNEQFLDSKYNGEYVDIGQGDIEQKSGLQYLCNDKGSCSTKKYLCVIGVMRDTQLNIHNKSHTEEKSFKWNFCDKAFSQKSNLSIHIKIHIVEKPFKCNFCIKAFSQKYKT